MLTEQKKRFVRYYIANGGNATQAAKKAGYSKKTANSQGQRLLKDVDIKNLLEKQRQKNAEKFEYTLEESFNNLLEAQKLALQRKNPLGSANPDLTNYLKAEELKGKLCGLFTEKKEITGSLEVSALKVEIIE